MHNEMKSDNSSLRSPHLLMYPDRMRDCIAVPKPEGAPLTNIEKAALEAATPEFFFGWTLALLTGLALLSLLLWGAFHYGPRIADWLAKVGR
jgi:hypothetical protein